MKNHLKIGLAVSALEVMAWAEGGGGGPPWGKGGEKPWQKHKHEAQDKAGKLPDAILRLQSNAKVTPPAIDDAVRIALAAARDAARPLIDLTFHKGRRIVVPDQIKTVQGAIDAAAAGDIVVVKAGVYFELIVMKDGVKLVSDASDGGDELVAVPGARLKLPKRALRTVLDGSKSKPSHHGMVDFLPGVGRHTIVDGFTFRNLPHQNHHIPGHAHGLNVRGASPVIMNCYLVDNGSTGIGNHVVFKDQKSPMLQRDFRWDNVRFRAEAVIYHNIITGSVGLGIGCNHFSAPFILGNEVFGNDDSELEGKPSPGMGAKHGAAPTTIGNLVHDNPGGGILCKTGMAQGAHPIDRRAHPTVMRNVVYHNGKIRAAIACEGGGTRNQPVRFVGNFIYDAGIGGIGLSGGAIGIIEDNIVKGSQAAGVAVSASTALKLDRNAVTGVQGPGFVLVGGSRILEMRANAADSNQGPRFFVRGKTVVGPAPAQR